jgi:hypothetical protein
VAYRTALKARAQAANRRRLHRHLADTLPPPVEDGAVWRDLRPILDEEVFEKVRYKWRRRRTIVRFIVLAFDRWHKNWLATTDEAQPVTIPHRRPRREPKSAA